MADLVEIEAALAADWDPEQLAVYGDFLQSMGDPRGELIAIDLAGRTNERAARKRELVVEWLGEDLATIVWHVGAVEHAFVHLGRRAPEMGTFALAELLAHPAGRYLRELTIEDAPPRISDALDLLAEAPRTWLARLRLVDAVEGNVYALARALAAMPQLRYLEVADRISRMLHIPPSIRVSRPTS